MKQIRSFPAFKVSQKAEISVKNGHPWIYDNEIIKAPDCENGAIADAFTEKGTYLGSGFVSFSSKIRLRLLSSDANEKFTEEFFRRRVKYAVDYRKTVMGDDFSCCRLIFGEADGLPGVTVDKYGSLLCAQILSYGAEMRKEIIYSALVSVLAENGCEVTGIFERSDASVRELEGLEKLKGWYEGVPHPDSAVTLVNENGIEYFVDLCDGQKTGFFLDQKYNRLAAAKIAVGKRVLDCFTHTGSFGLNAAKAGAERVTCVDISESAIELARENAVRNGLISKTDFICADVFELLPKLCEERADYNMVILDPPAFTKSRKTVASAERGYKEINFRAMKLLPRGGWLASCSCSHFMESEMFIKMLHSAAKYAGVTLKLSEFRRQAPDHPVLLGVPETDYLKFCITQIV